MSLIADLPLFIDPFLLFNSRKRRYQQLHHEVIRYLRFLRDKATGAGAAAGLLREWYAFPEIRQNWLGFSRQGNRGSGLGREFASALHANLRSVFDDFGKEKVTRGSHVEKLCLISDRVGRDKISDFITNLIHGYLLEYTQTFAQRFLQAGQTRRLTVDRVRFSYDTESWERHPFVLPYHGGDYVLLTPIDLLTRDDTWINRRDLVESFELLPSAISNDALREQVSNYFRKMLPKEPRAKDLHDAALETIRRFPELIDYYIRYKEDHGDEAEGLSRREVAAARKLFVEHASELIRNLASTPFYRLAGDTFDEAMQRVQFLKDVIENKGGHRIFYAAGQPIEREEDVHVLFKLTWWGTRSDVSSEVNDGRGPADFKISRGASDKTIVEFKLASNGQLKRNLKNQTDIYRKASNAKRAIKVIFYFSETELGTVLRILRELDIQGDPSVVLIDARADNKPSGSKA